MALEALASGRIFVAYNYAIDHTYFEQPEQTTDAINYIKSIDKGYYRVLYGSESYQIPGAPGAFVITTPNEPFSKNYPGFSFYNTVYNVETDDFYDRSRSNWFVSEAMGTLPVFIQDQIMQDYLVTEQSNNIEYVLNDNFSHIGQLPDEDHRELKLDEPLSNGNLYLVNYGGSEITLS